ncbi:MAG TPA: DUF202 domain-containing protein [Acidimicrobiia bacterium]|nr:DUF202 domain-containing protein [Acidimicrobiia bacterium]
MTADAGPPAAPTGGRPRGERVELAWERSGLAFAAIGVVLLRRTLPNVPVRPGLAVPLIIVGATAAVVGLVYREGLRGRAIHRRTELRLATGGAVCLGLLALVVSLIA